MNFIIGFTNELADRIWAVAVPILWQSSLLIVLLFGLDVLLRKWARPLTRYALWLTLLVKLVTPPSLAAPWNPAWWVTSAERFVPIRIATPAPARTLNADTVSVPPTQAPSAVVRVDPRAGLSMGGELLALSVAGSLVLLMGMLRWSSRVWKLLRSASAPSDSMGRLFEQARKSSDIRRAVVLRVTDQCVSPALCGFFRPCLVLPRRLESELSDDQMRAVLLHELVHLQRGDVLVNLLQTVLQIVYWWHPLLWMANARIRRLREQSVDDSVMLMLTPAQDVYAEALFRVAAMASGEFSFRSLGLVELFESQTSLRQRIERLVVWHRPDRSNLGWIALFWIVVFAGAVLPMGGAPANPSGGVVSNNNDRVVGQVPVGSKNADNLPIIQIKALFLELPVTEPGEPNAFTSLLSTWNSSQTNFPATESKTVKNTRALFPDPSMFQVIPSTDPTVTWVLSAEQTALFTNLFSVPHLPQSPWAPPAAVSASPRVATRSGMEAVISMLNTRSFVVGIIDPEKGSTPSTSNNRVITIGLGRVLDVVPFFDAGKGTVRVRARATISELLGYDKSKSGADLPIPRFRFPELFGEETVTNGQSLLLMGPVVADDSRMVSKVPFLGDIPLLGHLFRNESHFTVKKELAVLMTVTVEPAKSAEE